MIRTVQAWIPQPGSGPGRLEDVDLDVEIVDDRTVAAEGVTVAEQRPGPLFRSGSLRFDPCAGGGPLAPQEEGLQARAFGVLNATVHLQRGLRTFRRLGAPLPHLLVKVGMHAPDHWGGGHYRLPAPSYTVLEEAEPVAEAGEIHLGAGSEFLRLAGQRYFHAPAHDPAIICHELGHHLCRHTADFRLNQLRDPAAQTNHRSPIEEGTADFVAAILCDSADIYGWHRGHVPPYEKLRRCLDTPWTMADYLGGSEKDPHADGVVWASALWAARSTLQGQGRRAEEFDAAVVEALVAIGRRDLDLSETVLRRRRYFSYSLEAILESAAERGRPFAEAVAQAFATRGIVAGVSNRRLRRRARRLRRETAEATEAAEAAEATGTAWAGST